MSLDILFNVNSVERWARDRTKQHIKARIFLCFSEIQEQWLEKIKSNQQKKKETKKELWKEQTTFQLHFSYAF